MRAHDERLTEQGRERTHRTGRPYESPVAALLALQRTAGNDAVVRLLTAQRVPERTVREKRHAVSNSPYGNRPRSARQQAQQGFDPDAPRAPELPSRGPRDEVIWSGTRDDIGFTPATVNAVLAAAPSQNTNGRTEYQCAQCARYIPQLSDKTAADGNRYVTIDHATEIIAYVQANATAVTWQVDGRTVSAITRAEAKRWANDVNNLRVLCAQPCNGGTRAAHSASRHYDTNRAVWWAS
ncbi:hypothetical protein [Streptomyces sp. A012304]|uniref:hypothetical protein n=1 Tax=Streptomyces sp. A012304 TaxID=375446 RepID=UPI002231AE70|nr:hypothetical protein [Streptomyces sp. A012304]GKQ35272.1 hypothetical protein ALMP_18170 [Streptomyces sp. A012304]